MACRVHQLFHLAGEETLLEWKQDVESAPESGPAADAFWMEISNKWFTLFPTTRPYTMKGYEQIAENVRCTVHLYSHCYFYGLFNLLC